MSGLRKPPYEESQNYDSSLMTAAVSTRRCAPSEIFVTGSHC
jgi:hypothetical protein